MRSGRVAEWLMVESPTHWFSTREWGIRMISGVSAPRFRPFFAHFPPSLARSLRLGARKPDSAKKRRKNGGKRAQNGVETGVSDPYIRMPQPCSSAGIRRHGRTCGPLAAAHVAVRAAQVLPRKRWPVVRLRQHPSDTSRVHAKRVGLR